MGADPGKYKKRSPQWWDAIESEYVTGTDSLKDLAQKYGVPPSTVASRARRGKWSDRRAEHADRSRSAREGAVARAVELSKKTQAETRVEYAEAAKKLAQEIMALAGRLVDGNRAKAIDLARLAGALKQCQSIEFASLGIASEVLNFEHGDDGKVATWEELMQRERDRAGLANFSFAREESKSK